MTDRDKSPETCARCGQHEQYGCGCTEVEKLKTRCEQLLAAKETAEDEVDALRGKLLAAKQVIHRLVHADEKDGGLPYFGVPAQRVTLKALLDLIGNIRSDEHE